MEAAATDFRRYNLIREKRLDRAKANFFPEKSPGGDFYAGLMGSISTSATDYAKSVLLDTGHDEVDGWGWSPFHELLDKAVEVVQSIMTALNGWDVGEKTKPKVWRHNQFAVQSIMRGETPDMDRQQIECVVSDYLALPFRNPRIDRLLVDLLMALELYAFGKESRSAIKQHSLWGWFKYRIYNLIFWGAIVWLAWAMAGWNWISFGAAGTTQTVCIALYLLETVWTTVWLFRKNPRTKLLLEMNSVYAELHSDGPISAQRVEERAKAAGDVGVFWPAPLYVLLEDIKARGGRF